MGGAFDDNNSPAANTVVEDDCTGTFITPKLILTAAHCLVGSSDTGCNHSTTLPVRIGATAATPVTTVGSATETGCADLAHLQAFDIALLYALPNPTHEDEYIDAIAPFRPTFGKPNTQTDLIGVAGWSSINSSNLTTRQVKIFSNLNLDEQTGDLTYPPGTGWWHHDGADISVDHGDSGGPLFVARPNGSLDPYTWARDPIGVLSEGNLASEGQSGNNAYWADITAPANRDWIVHNALDRNAVCGDTRKVQDGTRGVFCNHSDKWLAQHGKIRDDFWYGEVDYTTTPAPGESDVDGDHWYDEHDNCPFLPNVDQADANDDGIGDDCHLCPCDPGNNADGDAVCGAKCTQGTPGCPQWCWGYYEPGADNCPNIKNDDQANCNDLAEQARPSEVLGDACDPVPCPQSDMAATSTEVTCTLTNCDPAVPPSYCDPNMKACIGTQVHDTAHLNPIGAHERVSQYGNLPVEIPVASVTTTSRFCQARAFDPAHLDLLEFNCRNHGVINDDQLTKTGDYRTPLTPWHGITAAIASQDLFLLPDATFAEDFGASDVQMHWYYETDLARWLADPTDPLIPLPYGNSTCIGSATANVGGVATATTCLGGTIWFNGDTHYGQDDDNAYIFYTNELVRIGSHGLELANNYVDFRPDDNIIAYCPTLNPELNIPGLTFDSGANAGPSPIMTWAFTSATSGLSSTIRAFDIRSRPDTELLAETSIGAAVIQNDGSLIATQDQQSSTGTINCGGSTLGSALRARLKGPLGWANAVEPDGRVGRHPEYLAFVVASDGTRVIDAAVSQGATADALMCSNCDAPPPC